MRAAWLTLPHGRHHNASALRFNYFSKELEKQNKAMRSMSAMLRARARVIITTGRDRHIFRPKEGTHVSGGETPFSVDQDRDIIR